MPPIRDKSGYTAQRGFSGLCKFVQVYIVVINLVKSYTERVRNRSKKRTFEQALNDTLKDPEKRHVFQFDSGTRIEVFFHLGLETWMATWEKEYAVFRSTADSKRSAVKKLREDIAAQVARKLRPKIFIHVNYEDLERRLIAKAIQINRMGRIK